MALQLSTTLRNNEVGQISSTVGTAPKLYLYSGAVPANCAASDPSGLLATLTLPSTWLNAASGGAVTIAGGPWTGTGSAAGTAASFRIKDSTGTTCHLQGTVTATGAGGDMTLDNTSIASSQNINITGFTVTAGNA
jgi:hypothetical protein